MKGLSATSIVIFSVLVLVSGNTQNAFGDKPTAIIFVYNGPGGFLQGFDEGPMMVMTPYTTTPNGDQNGVMVIDGDIVTVTPGTAPLTDKAPGSLDTNSHFFVNGIELFVIPPSGDQTVGDNPHTSCSKQLKVGDFMLMIAGDGHKLTVLSVEGSNNDPDCEEGDIPPPPDIVGGHGGITDNTALLVSGSHLTASWMIPLLVSAIGIGVFVVTRK